MLSSTTPSSSQTNLSFYPLITATKTTANRLSLIVSYALQKTEENSSIDPLRLSQVPSNSSLNHLISQKPALSLIQDCPPETDPHKIHTIYDQECRVVDFFSNDKSVDFALNYEGNKLTITNKVNGEKHIQVTDELGRLLEETFPSGLTMRYEYVNNALSRIILPDQSEVHYKVVENHITEVTRYSSDLVPVYNHKYHFISDYHVNQTLISDLGTSTYSYDQELGQLLITSPSLCQSYEVDNSQNILSKKVNDKTTKYNYSNNELLCDQLIESKEIKLSYDKYGRIDTKETSTDIFNYSYNALNQLTKVETSDKTIEYNYDIMGRRTSKSVIQNGEIKHEYYTFFNTNEIGIYDENKTPKHIRVLGAYENPDMALAIAIESHGKTYAPIYDRMFNITQLIDTESNQSVFYDIDPFGENLTKINPLNPWVFATKSLDVDTGLVNFGYRQYDPSIKQWTTKDPIENADPDKTYVYCNNDPVKYTDPDGRWGFALSLVIPIGRGAIAGLVAGGPVGLIAGAIAGAAVGTGIGLAANAMYKKRDIKQYEDAVKDVEKKLGRKLKENEWDLFHDHITGQGYDYHDIVEEGFHLFDDRYRNN